MSALTISREQLVNSFRTIGAVSAIGGGVASVAYAIFNQDYTYPCTAMILGASTWVIISIGGCSQQEGSKAEEKQAAKQVLKEAFNGRVDKAGEDLKKKLQGGTSALVDLAVVSAQAGLTTLPCGSVLGAAVGSAGESSKGLSNVGISSSVDAGASSVKSSGSRSIDYSAGKLSES
jgi:hypothetical protein